MGLLFSSEKRDDWNLFEIEASDTSYRSEADMADFSKILLENSLYLRHVEIHENNYSIEALSKLFKTLSECPLITSMTLSKVTRSLDDPSIIDFFSLMNDSLISSFRELTVLELPDNKISEEAIEVLSPYLESTKKLEEFVIDGNSLKSEGASRLSDALSRNFDIKLILFSADNNAIDDAGALELALFFNSIDSLRYISLSKNRIRKNGISALAKSFTKQKDLQVIKLSENFLNEHDAYVSLAETLEELAFLSELKLADCFLCDDGAERIAHSLQRKEWLVETDFSFNDISSDSAFGAISLLAQSCPRIEVIDITGNYPTKVPENPAFVCREWEDGETEISVPDGSSESVVSFESDDN